MPSMSSGVEETDFLGVLGAALEGLGERVDGEGQGLPGSFDHLGSERFAGNRLDPGVGDGLGLSESSLSEVLAAR